MEIIFLVVGVGQLPQEERGLRRFGQGGGIAAQGGHPHPDDALPRHPRHEGGMEGTVFFIPQGKQGFGDLSHGRPPFGALDDRILPQIG